MAKLLKQSIPIFITCAMLVFNVSAGHAETDVTAPNSDHAGFYVGGTLGGVDIPTGRDENGISSGFNWTIKGGYQFSRNLAVETGYHLSVGMYNTPYSGQFGTQTTEGSWSFMEMQFPFPFIDLKPIIPLNSSSDLYFIAGVSYDLFQIVTSNLDNNITYSSTGLGYKAGIGYECYIMGHISLGGELIYHHFTHNRFTVRSNGTSETVTYPYNLNMSFTSLNFVFLYHF